MTAQLAERSGVATLALILLAIQFLPTRAPLGIYAAGLVSGCLLALNAVGLVLTYRGNRIINFGQVQIGTCGGVLFALFVKYQTFLNLGHSVCGACIPKSARGGWALDLNYVISVTAGIGFSALVSWLVYIGIIKRLEAAPRVVASVGTLFMAVVVAGIAGEISNHTHTPKKPVSPEVLFRSLVPPFHFRVVIGPATFGPTDLVAVVATAIAVGAVMWLLYRSRTGVALRAAAESPQRALTVGIAVGRVTGRLWWIIGTLAGIGGVVTAMYAGNNILFGTGDPFATDMLVYVLVVCVLARFVSLPMAVAGSLVVGVMQDAVLWSEKSTFVISGVVFGLVLLVLLVQTRRVSRAEAVAAGAWHATRETRPTPRELKPLGPVRSWRRSLIGVGAVVALGLPWILDVGQTNLAAVVLISGIFGVSVLVLTGWAGQISLGQVGIAAVGAYVVGATHLPFLVALIAAGLLGAASSVALGVPALRLRGLHLAVTSLAFAYAVAQILVNPSELGKYLRSIVGRPDLLGLSLEDGRSFYYSCLVLLALTVAALIGIRHSRVGRTLLAMRDNETAAQLFGVPFVRAQLGAFAVAGFIAALGGAMFAYSQHGVNATSFGPDQSLLLFLCVVIGGLGSVSAPLLGVGLFGALQIFNVTLPTQYLVIGIVGFVIVRFMPGGVGMLVFRLRDAFLRRVAYRYRIVVPSLFTDAGAAGWENQIAPIRPKVRPGGGTVFIPRVYRLSAQWLAGSEGVTPTGTRSS
ncbi:MAG TPA: ABC transporter permease [Mycobacteriales bacterium]|nr:ABC transporter permease [Mycobacteriales bacterium]